MRNWSLVFVLLVLLSSCDTKRWNGYSLSDSGLYYQIHRLGDGQRKAIQGDRVYAAIAVFDEENRLLYRNGMEHGAFLQIKLGRPQNGSISEAVSLLHQGDSASFYFPESIPIAQISNGKLQTWSPEYRMDIALNRIEGEEELESTADMELLELKALKNFLDESGFDASRSTQGVYLKTLKRGTGARPQSGQMVQVHYSGKFINGQEFDNTRNYGFPLEFQLGKPDQVIRAIEVALHHTEVGGKIAVASASPYAFGEGGSSSGIIPPFTSVVYEIELVGLR